MELMPKLTRADVLRARRAYRLVADLPELERIAVATYGDAAYAPSTTARFAAKIAAIWAEMSPAERDEFHRVLAAQVGEIPDTLPIDVGEAAREIVDGARGRAGAPQDFPGLRNAVHELVRCWKERGGTVEVGRLKTTDGRNYPGEPPLRPVPMVRFVAAGVLRAVPEEYRMMQWPDAKRRLLVECHRCVRALRDSRLI